MNASTSFIELLISKEVEGKNAAIHGYDKSLWAIRSGYLTLVFAGWGFLIKAGLDNGLNIASLQPYVVIMMVFSVVITTGAYFIDTSYVKRKFRVITALNKLIVFIAEHDLNEMDAGAKKLLAGLLQISGDADNKSYRSGAYRNELGVKMITYVFSLLSIFGVVVYVMRATK